MHVQREPVATSLFETAIWQMLHDSKRYTMDGGVVYHTGCGMSFHSKIVSAQTPACQKSC
jgi:hypothetical protein